MLDKNAVGDAKDVSGDPVHRKSKPLKRPVHHDEITVSNDRSVFVFQGRRHALDEFEQSFASRLDAGAVLEYTRETSSTTPQRSPAC